MTHQRCLTLVGGLGLSLLVACGGPVDGVSQAVVQDRPGVTLPPPDPLPPSARFAQAEHAVGEASRLVDGGEHEAALEALAGAGVLDPSNRQALFVRGRIHLDSRRATEALAVFEEARAMQADVSAFEWIGLAYLALRDEHLDELDVAQAHAESARRSFEEVLALDPANGNSRHNLGYCSRLVGNPEESVRILQALLSDQPERVRTLYELGVSQQAAGQTGAARETFQRLLGIQPEHGSARVALEALGG